MNRLLVLVIASLALLSVGTVTWAARPAYAPNAAPAATKEASKGFEVEGKILSLHKGWLELSVTRVINGELKPNARIRVTETAKTSFMENGKRANMSALKAGELVRVTGHVEMRGKASTYIAQAVTIEQ